MAPARGRKRTRSLTIDSELEIETASSNLRQQQPATKRIRHPSIDDEGEYDNEPARPVMPNGTVNGRYNTSEDDDDEMDDDDTVTRIASELRAKAGGEVNRPADSGIIEEVTMTNFMCHDHLSVPLGPLMNFIIGHNGSGKSAALTALQLCLGGKATSTNRGQSLKSFIKEGKEQCTLVVKIKNQGENAYRHDEFGDSIIVERIFSRAGTSGFKIKNEHGKIISTRKSDLEDILDALALQMDNPMNVLTQDMARQFLNSSNAKEKYKFFYQGTHLEQLDSDYKILEASLDNNLLQSSNLKDSMDKAHKDYYEIARKAEMAERLAGLNDRSHNLYRQMAWVQVEEQEKALAEIESQVRDQEKKIQERLAMAANKDAVVSEAETALETAKQAFSEIESELLPKRDEHAAAKEDFDTRATELKEELTQQRAIGAQIKTAINAVARYQAKVDEERLKIAAADDGRHADMMDEIEEVKAALEQLQSAEMAKSSESREIDRAIQTASEEQKKARERLDASTTNMRQSEQRIRSLQGSSKNWSNAYHESVRTLLRLIDEESRFHQKPVGPIGRYVALLHPKWTRILERQAATALNDFIVTSQDDQKLLSRLIGQAGYRGRVQICPSRPIDTSQHEPAADLLTWMRALKFENDLVRNSMIINQSIDKTLLVDDTNEAEKLIQKRLPNVAQVFTFQRRGGWGDRLALSSSGAVGAQPIEPWKGAPRMQTDESAQIEMEKETLAELKREHTVLEASHRDTQNKLKEANQSLARHKKAMRELKLDRERAEIKLQDLKTALEDATPQTGTLETLEAELRQHKESKEMYENQFKDSVNLRDKLGRENKASIGKLTDLNREIEELEARLAKANKNVQKAEEKRTDLIRNANKAHEEAKDAENDKNRLAEQRQAQLVTIDEFTASASEISARVPVDPDETADSLDEKLKRLCAEKLRFQREVGADQETLNLKKIEAKSYADKRRRDYEYHSQVVDQLKQALGDRKKRWEKFREMIITRAKGTFLYHLSERQFRGKLRVSHADRLLDIHVQPDPTKRSGGGRTTKTLSGGEKSFSTICLLLALWEAMGSPIRCLDEFDVFMDQVNRDVSLGLLIKAARRAVGRQFILISPQAMGSVTLDKDVRVIKMRDPERGQTTLTQYGVAQG